MKYRIDGREERLSFGIYPTVTLAQARGFRDDARALLANGDDPGVIKKALKQTRRAASGHTFSRLAEAFMAKAVKEGRTPATQDKTAWLLGMANADFGSMPITEITSPMVLTCLRKVEAKGNYETARRLRAKIGAVFRYAIATGVGESDPTFALRDALIRPQVTPRAAITDPKVLGGLFEGYRNF